MLKRITIHWFRQDLRLADNPSLCAAAARGEVLPIFILDDENSKPHPQGAASRWWLHHSLAALNDSLGGKLNLYQGDPQKVISALCDRYDVQTVVWNRCYEPWRIARDTEIKQMLLQREIHCESFNSALRNEPWEVLKKDKTPYLIFTPYYRQASVTERNGVPLSPPKDLVSTSDAQSVDFSDLSLLPSIPWDKDFYEQWQPGESGASASLSTFLMENIDTYKDGRDFPAQQSVSRLSPHLHFGEISPKQIEHALLCVADDDNIEHFKRELLWREFSYYLLFHFPHLPEKSLKSKFDFFPWLSNPENLKKWQQGQTGYPIIDAGMRELWQTGTMHNRVRMITASFLVKNLLIDWRLGAEWFWDCLLDADLASNSASWQWVAGCGTDAAPYFRIFNPITQGEKFDPHGEYTKCFVPELKDLPKKYLYRPWEAPSELLEEAGVVLGENYPEPIVDVKASRERALDAFQFVKQVAAGN